MFDCVQHDGLVVILHLKNKSFGMGFRVVFLHQAVDDTVRTRSYLVTNMSASPVYPNRRRKTLCFLTETIKLFRLKLSYFTSKTLFQRSCHVILRKGKILKDFIKIGRLYSRTHACVSVCDIYRWTNSVRSDEDAH